jgi:myo-inositol-1(or 4)-monophosphatase
MGRMTGTLAATRAASRRVLFERVIAERGKGAFLNDQRLRVAGRQLNECVIACGLPHIGRGDHVQSRDEMTELQPRVAGLRRFGSAALDMAFIAAGRFDGYWERNLSQWDMAASCGSQN